MNGYAMHGHSKETIDMFLSMLQNGLKPDAITFTSVLSACCQNGLTEEGWYYFNSMSKEHGIEPRREHYACMVTLLSRTEKLDEAYSMIKEMPSEPDAFFWGALLSSFRIYHNSEMGKIAAEKVFKLEPENPGNYALLSNMYASKGLWSDVNRVRYVMKSNGIYALQQRCWRHDVYIRLSERRVPEWFHQRSDSNMIMFYARGKYLPRFSLCISVVNVKKEITTVSANYGLCINGHAEIPRFLGRIDGVGHNHELRIFNPRVPGSLVPRNWVYGYWNRVVIGLSLETNFGQNLWTSAVRRTSAVIE